MVQVASCYDRANVQGARVSEGLYQDARRRALTFLMCSAFAFS